MINRAPVPLVTIGGFLGAGKTTLVNHILRNAGGQRIVVFVNDFGAINIDYDLIETEDTDRVSLSNGCVCCSLNDDLIGAIIGFCEGDPPDAFIVEASGVADPRALDQSIASLQQVGHVECAQRVYVLDAEQFESLEYADTEEIVDHAAACDLIVLNKSDLVDVERLSAIETLLQRSAPRTLQMRATFGNIAVNELLDARVNIGNFAVFQPSFGEAKDRFESFSCSDFKPIRKAQFLALLDDLKRTALRAKGVVYFDEDPSTPVRFDHVGQRCSIRELRKQDAATAPTACFVAIGWRDCLDRAALSMALGKSLEPLVICSSPG